MTQNAIAYKLSIFAETPKTATVGKQFKITYHIRNIGNNTFLGGKILVKISWAVLEASTFVSVPIEINKNLEPNEEFVYTQKETPLASGYTLFTLQQNDFPATNKSKTYKTQQNTQSH